MSDRPIPIRAGIMRGAKRHVKGRKGEKKKREKKKKKRN
jgi:hypothetical protein